MGVKHLWDILESCKKNLPLHHLQNKRLCIDLSCWIVQLQNVGKSHASMKEKFYLRSLFHRLRALIALNCRLIFVTDGSIPAIKLSTYKRRLGSDCEVTRDEENSQKMCSLQRNMGSEFSCMIKEAKVLGMALGIPCLDGVEEAEAQCALLNSESLCDGCFTTDSDAFLFGARTVYRDICLGEGGFVVCYEMVDIERELGFGRNSLISLALLLGSDYSQGVHGLGPERACQFVKAVGDDIALQLVASEGLKFTDKIKKSKKKGQICKSNENEENGFAHKVYTSGHDLCSLQDDQFLQVIDAYLKPKCHSPDSAAVHRVLAQHLFHRDKLQQICSEFFGWPPEKTDEYILPKIAERDLRRFANLRSTSSDLGVQLPLHMMPVRCPICGIIKPRKVQGRECFEVAWEGFDGLKTSIVPSDLIKSACPEKVEEFDEEKAQRKKKSCKPGAKKPEKEASVTEVGLKLQGLLLDIEAASNILFNTDVCSIEKKSEIRDTVIDATHANQKKHDFLLDRESESNSHDLVGSNDTEVIDLLSPSPPIHSRNASKCQEATYQQIDVIDSSESETEVSPDHQRKARELRSFLASVKDDIH